MPHLRGAGFVACVAFLLAMVTLPTVALAQDATLHSTLTYVGPGPGESSIFRFDYTLTNVAVTPQIIELLVFFDSNPDNGAEFLGDYSDFNNTPGFTGETTAPVGWMADVFEDPDPGPWAVDFLSPAGLNAVHPGQALAGFSVTFLWKGEGLPGVQFFEALDGFAHEGQSIIVGVVYPAITGRLTSGCTGQPLVGVTVDLYTENDVHFATTVTDADGRFTFSNLSPGNYSITVASPIGYADPADPIATPGQHVDLALDCLPAGCSVGSAGFWKHQACSHGCKRGKAQITRNTFIGYLDSIYQHFAQNPVHPVLVYTVPPSAPAKNKIAAACNILDIGCRSKTEKKARAQFMAVLLNVASLKLPQTRVISADGATVSQAITYVWDLIADGVSTNDKLARDIAEKLNTGQLVPAGWIPLSTPIYSYSEPDVAVEPMPPTTTRLLLNAPNPVPAAGTDIRFHLAGDGDVRVAIYDVQGRPVRTVFDGYRTAGEHAIHWDGRDDRGTRPADGIYFYTLTSGGGTVSRKLVVTN